MQIQMDMQLSPWLQTVAKDIRKHSIFVQKMRKSCHGHNSETSLYHKLIFSMYGM